MIALRWKVIDKWSAETSADLIKFMKNVVPLNWGLIASL